MQVADKSVFGIKTPDKALELIGLVIEQYFGEYWTQHKPRCPLCNNGLQDTEKHMNRPVGECTNTTCDSTIHISDFMGKIKDVLSEWDVNKEDWLDEMRKALAKKVQQHKVPTHAPYKSQVPAQHRTVVGDTDNIDSEVIDEETVFVW